MCLVPEGKRHPPLEDQAELGILPLVRSPPSPPRNPDVMGAELRWWWRPKARGFLPEIAFPRPRSAKPPRSTYTDSGGTLPAAGSLSWAFPLTV